MKTTDLNHLIEKTRKLCDLAGINEFSAFRFLYENILQIYVLSHCPAPAFLRKNLQVQGAVRKSFAIDEELQKWWQVIDQSISPTSRAGKIISKEKWKDKVYSINPSQCCSYCRKTIKKEESEVDHIVPRDLGGFDQESNYTLSCFLCNNGKRNSPSTLYFNIFNFKTNFQFLFHEEKKGLKSSERFQILQWADFKCQKCLTDKKPLVIYYLKDPGSGGQAMLGNSYCFCPDCGINHKKVEDA